MEKYKLRREDRNDEDEIHGTLHCPMHKQVRQKNHSIHPKDKHWPKNATMQIAG